MHSLKKTALAAAVLAAMTSSTAFAAQPSAGVKALQNTVEDLRKQLQDLRKQQSNASSSSLEQARIEELRKQVLELRELLQKQQAAQLPATLTAAPNATPGGTEEEAQEAVEARTPATKADIQGLRTDLENYKYDQSRLQERNIPSVTRNTKIGGSITARYDFSSPGVAASNSSSGNGPTEPREHGFKALSVGLNFAGNLYRDYAEGRNLTYRLAFAGSNTATSSTTTLNVTDAYLRYSFQPASGNAEDPLGTITLGQQVIPFGLDAQALDPEVKSVIGNAGFVSGLGMGTRQVGLVLAGDFSPYVDFTNNYRAPLLAYSLGLFNGNGPNKDDNNDYKDIAARLVYTLPVDYSSWFRQLQVGVSGYRGYTSLGAASSTAVTTGVAKGNYDRYGFDVNWTHLPFSIAYEWAYGKQELVAATAKNPDAQIRGLGQYINLGYTWGEQFLNSSKQQGKFDDWWPQSYQAFLRFDSWDPNRSSLSTDDHKLTTTLGLNVFFAETTKFQVNFLHDRNLLGDTAPTAAKPKRVNTLQGQFSATF